MHFKKSLFGTSRTLAPRAEEKLLKKKKNQIVWQSVNCLLACLVHYNFYNFKMCVDHVEWNYWSG